jgi:hypothetical protein
MKIDCVLTATNLNETYCEFIPIFIKTWKKLIPTVDVKIVLIADDIPLEYKEYNDNIILFKPIDNISTAFISQYIRLLYPALLQYNNGVIISDMDMLPLNSKYYINNVNNIDNDKFIYYRNVLLNDEEIAMCYNIATPKIWATIFNINNENDIINKLRMINSEGINWSTDQKHLFKYVMEWNKLTNNLVILKDQDTGFRRLDRGRFILNEQLSELIKIGYFSDYHALRPHNKYKDINEYISNLL